MLLIVGLGNPGSKYSDTRHNIGFMAVDAITEHYHFPSPKTKFNALLTQGMCADKQVLLMKPQTFMNLSGDAVQNVVQFYKLTPKQVIIIHDEFALRVGEVKLKQSGNNAGHNGLKSIDSVLGTTYPRIRIGIGPVPEFGDVSDFVLSKFSSQEKKRLNDVINLIKADIPRIIETFETENFTNKKFLFPDPDDPDKIVDVTVSVKKT